MTEAISSYDSYLNSRFLILIIKDNSQFIKSHSDYNNTNGIKKAQYYLRFA
jgi:hypothetical protein